MEMLLVEKYRKEAETLRTQLAKANELADKAERAEKIATLAAQDMNLEKSIALEKVQKLEKTLGNCADGLAKANKRVEELECSVDKANEMLEEVRASGDLGLYMDNKLTAFLVGDSEQLRKGQE